MNQYNDLRITDRSSLADAQEAFFRSGGKIHEIESFEFKPLPPRIEPKLTPEELELRKVADQIRELSATMIKTEMAKHMGISQDRITKICRMYGIKLINGSGRNASSKGVYAINPEEDKKTVERMRALAAIGLSKNKARAQVDIGWHKFSRLVQDYSIEFPGRGK